MRLYKFLSAENAIKTIASRRLKIATFPEMNDPFELAGVKLVALNAKSIFASIPARAYFEFVRRSAAIMKGADRHTIDNVLSDNRVVF